MPAPKRPPLLMFVLMVIGAVAVFILVLAAQSGNVLLVVSMALTAVAMVGLSIQLAVAHQRGLRN